LLEVLQIFLQPTSVDANPLERIGLGLNMTAVELGPLKRTHKQLHPPWRAKGRPFSGSDKNKHPR